MDTHDRSHWSGSLALLPLAEVLAKLHRERASGTLLCTRGGGARSVALRDGRPRWVTAGDLEDSYAAFLFRCGHADFDETFSSEAGPGKTLDEARAAQLRQDHAIELLLGLFSWSEGVFCFVPGDARDAGGPAIAVSFQAIVARGLERVTRTDWLRSGAGEVDLLLEAADDADPALVRELSEETCMVLGAVRLGSGLETVGDLPWPSDFRTLRSLWELRLLGLVRPGSGESDGVAVGALLAGHAAQRFLERRATPEASRKHSRPPGSNELRAEKVLAESVAYRVEPFDPTASAAPAVETRPDAVAKPRAPQPAAKSPAEAAPVRPAPAPPAPPPAVPPIAPKTPGAPAPAAISPAPAVAPPTPAARSFEPETRPAQAVSAATEPNPMPILDEICADDATVISECSPYREDDSVSWRQAPGVSEMDKTELPSSGPAVRQPQDVGGEWYQNGERFLREMDLFNAVTSFREAVRLCPTNAEYLFKYGMTLARNPKWRKEAEECLLKAIDLKPWLARYHIALGKLYAESNLIKRAEARFKAALEAEPMNQHAQREMQELQKKQRKTTTTIDAAALLGRFGRKGITATPAAAPAEGTPLEDPVEV